ASGRADYLEPQDMGANDADGRVWSAAPGPIRMACVAQHFWRIPDMRIGASHSFPLQGLKCLSPGGRFDRSRLLYNRFGKEYLVDDFVVEIGAGDADRW